MIDADVLDSTVRAALEEDLGHGDITSELTLDPQSESEGIILARAEGVLAGMPAAENVFLQVEPRVVVSSTIGEGDSFKSGEIIAHIAGPTAGILAGERVALNFLQGLCGIATRTRQFVDAVEGTGVTILDTRKTTPGLRELQKYAVRMGGGINHRMGLFDGVLIKENHVHAAGGVNNALERVITGLAGSDSRFLVVVEVTTMEQAREGMEGGADRLLLDNMEPEEMAAITAMVRDSDRSDLEIEASGGVTLSNVREIAESGVDYISIGAITHSVKAVDISLLLR